MLRSGNLKPQVCGSRISALCKNAVRTRTDCSTALLETYNDAVASKAVFVLNIGLKASTKNRPFDDGNARTLLPLNLN